MVPIEKAFPDYFFESDDFFDDGRIWRIDDAEELVGEAGAMIEGENEERLHSFLVLNVGLFLSNDFISVIVRSPAVGPMWPMTDVAFTEPNMRASARE